MKTNSVTATEANRSFSKLLRAVERGEKVEITSHGRKIAVLSPAELEGPTREQRLKALENLKTRWATQPHITIGPWTREELYERD
jgi:prevent-host-death family protein